MDKKSSGEFGFIDNIKNLFGTLSSGKYEGIGDDCSVIPISNRESIVVTTDMLVEGVHFIKDKINPYDLGWKSLAVNISDVASMGAVPFASFLSISIPKSIDSDYLDSLMRGYYDISSKFGVELLGGDTTASVSGIVINVTAIGRLESCRIKRRSSAKVGDVIVVSSTLGDSATGLRLLLEDKFDSCNSLHIALERKHHSPMPHVAQGAWLALNGVNAMMDISDGVSSDIRHICNASLVGAAINIDNLPLSSQMVEVASCYGWSVVDMALSGGEDYSLLFTVDSCKFEAINRAFEQEFGERLFRIGEIEQQLGVRYSDSLGRDVSVKVGFTHF